MHRHATLSSRWTQDFHSKSEVWLTYQSAWTSKYLYSTIIMINLLYTFNNKLNYLLQCTVKFTSCLYDHLLNLLVPIKPYLCVYNTSKSCQEPVKCDERQFYVMMFQLFIHRWKIADNQLPQNSLISLWEIYWFT